MSNQEISHDLYKWLVSLEILPNRLRYKASGNYQLDSRLQQQLQCGYLVSQLISKIAGIAEIPLNGPLLASIKNSNTPATRMYNWNILNEQFQKLGFSIGKQRHKQIVSGNFYSLSLFLLDLQKNNRNQKAERTEYSKKQQNGIDIRSLKKYEQINQSSTVLEYMLVLIGKCLALNGKQAVATLAQSAKYLAHLIVKGVKGSFQEILDFVQESTQKMSEIMFLAEKDPQKNLQFLLQIYKPVLISRQSDVTKKGLILFQALVYESFKYSTKNIIYQILSRESQGFDFIYMGLKRHPELNYEFFDFLHIFLEGIWKDFFEIQFKRTINNEQQFVNTVVLILQPLLQNEQAKKQVFSSGILQIWQKNYLNVISAKMKGQQMIAINQETKNSYTVLMYTVWMGYYKIFPQHKMEQMLIKLTQQLKRSTRSQIYTVRIPSLYRLFNILDFLAKNKNKLAALLYKKVIFLFVQNHEQSWLRQIILQNLTKTIKTFQTIPLEYLLQPMLKQLTNSQGTSYILNMYDFQFVLQLCVHPKMEQYYAVAFLDYFIKLYTKSVIFWKLIFRIIQAITARFCQSDQIRQYCLKFTQQSLSTYSMLTMSKTRPQSIPKISSSLPKQQQIMINQKKSLIIQLIRHFIHLEHVAMTQVICDQVVRLFLDWYQNRNHYDKGLVYLLMEIGDVQEILVRAKEKAKQEELQRKQQQAARLGKSRGTDREGSPGQRGQGDEIVWDGYDSKELSRLERSRIDSSVDRSNLHDEQIPLKKYKPSSRIPQKPLPNTDPRVLQNLQSIKTKWKEQQSRNTIEQQNKKKQKQQKIDSMSPKQLVQRQQSLGYSKMNDIGSDMIFQYGSVKKMYLRDSLALVQIGEEEDREGVSYGNICGRYEKYLRNLFNRYVNRSNKKQQGFLNFTELMRMLKQKSLIAKIPKIAINEIIAALNNKRKKQRNILSGIFYEDFSLFLLYYTDLLLMFDKGTKIDEPIGVKMENVVLKLLEGQPNVRQLFDIRIQKLKEDLEFSDDVEIPKDYKKVKQTQIQLSYTLHPEHTGLSNNYVKCYEILDGIVYEALGMHILTPFMELKQKTTLIRKVPNKLPLPQKPMSQNLQKSNVKQRQMLISKQSFTSDQKKRNETQQATIVRKSLSQRNMQPNKQSPGLPLPRIGKKQITTQEQRIKRQEHEQHAKKLREQVQRMKLQKQKQDAEKKQEEKKQIEKKKKKQMQRQQYLEENRKKVLARKQEEQLKAKEAEQIEKQKKEKSKIQVKEKEAIRIEKQKKNLQEQRQKIMQKQKEKQKKEKKKEMMEKSKSPDKVFSQVKQQLAEKKQKQESIKKSIQSGKLKKVIQDNSKKLQELFENYWNWQAKRIDLKNFAQIMKDFETSKYIHPKQISEVYKSISKGELLSLEMFIECLVKLAYGSSQIEQNLKQKGKIISTKQNIQIEPLQFLFQLLKMKEADYKQVMARIKKQKQIK